LTTSWGGGLTGRRRGDGGGEPPDRHDGHLSDSFQPPRRSRVLRAQGCDGYCLCQEYEEAERMGCPGAWRVTERRASVEALGCPEGVHDGLSARAEREWGGGAGAGKGGGTMFPGDRGGRAAGTGRRAGGVGRGVLSMRARMGGCVGADRAGGLLCCSTEEWGGGWGTEADVKWTRPRRTATPATHRGPHDPQGSHGVADARLA